jgi:hypothetical protein
MFYVAVRCYVLPSAACVYRAVGHVGVMFCCLGRMVRDCPCVGPIRVMSVWVMVRVAGY